MGNAKRVILLVISLMAVCVIPVLLFSESRQEYFEGLLAGEQIEERKGLGALVIFLLFTGDIVLPIPSSAVCAVAGKWFGVVGGSLLCWLGLNVSTLIGYLMGWFFGWRAVQWFSSEEDVESVRKDIETWGIWTIVGLRPLPILAEASILLLGTYRYPMRKFWPPMLVANLLVSVCFVLLGTWYADQDNFIAGLVVSCALPIVALAVWFYIQNSLRHPPTDSGDSGTPTGES